jgi:endonuclease/exonuclease/phosphatase family metal-dependent hydrolase
MMRFLAALVLVLIAAPASARERLRVMTFNVRVPVASDGANDWPHRRDLLAETIRKAAPDLIGTQELKAEQGDFIVANLPRYAWFGRDRRGGRSDEHMGVFYRRDRLTLLASGDFQLSDTPDVPGSISWGHPYPRMVTWGRFRTRGGATLVLLNTHLPYRAEDEAAREKGARLILAKLPAIAGSDPVVLTGDFNTTPDSASYRLLTASLPDAYTQVRATGPEKTFHAFTGTPDRRIDWILVRDARVLRLATLADHRGTLYPSDHFPVVADLEIRSVEEHRGGRGGDQQRTDADRPRR